MNKSALLQHWRDRLSTTEANRGSRFALLNPGRPCHDCAKLIRHRPCAVGIKQWRTSIEPAQTNRLWRDRQLFEVPRVTRPVVAFDWRTSGKDQLHCAGFFVERRDFGAQTERRKFDQCFARLLLQQQQNADNE